MPAFRALKQQTFIISQFPGSESWEQLRWGASGSDLSWQQAVLSTEASRGGGPISKLTQDLVFQELWTEGLSSSLLVAG